MELVRKCTFFKLTETFAQHIDERINISVHADAHYNVVEQLYRFFAEIFAVNVSNTLEHQVQNLIKQLDYFWSFDTQACLVFDLEYFV